MDAGTFFRDFIYFNDGLIEFICVHTHTHTDTEHTMHDHSCYENNIDCQNENIDEEKKREHVCMRATYGMP